MTIDEVRHLVRVSIARHLPVVLERGNVRRIEGEFAAMFGDSLRALLAAVADEPAVRETLPALAGHLLLAELRESGECHGEELAHLVVALDEVLRHGMGSAFSWALHRVAPRAFLLRRANHGAPGNLTLAALREAFGPKTDEKVDRREELREYQKRGLKVARMCKELRIPRSRFYAKFLTGIWPDESPEVQAVRTHFRKF
jgi:hypothetical protein